MSETQGRENTGRRLMLCADAFLFSGALFMLTEGLMGIVVALTGSEVRIPEWLEFAGIFLILGSLVAGVVTAWRVHGRAWQRNSWIGLLLGVVVGGAAMNLLIMAIATFGRFIPNPVPDEGPWGLVIVTVVAVVAFLAVPVLDAIRDLTGQRVRVRIDTLRLAAFAVIVALVAATVVVGIQQESELGEAGLFMVLLAAPAALAVLGMDLFEAWRSKRDAGVPSVRP
ncbi:MAG: hypothetical protein WCF12_06695 [Propionicimonas sp.]